MSIEPIRVVVVDDHPMFRMGLAAAIGEMDGIVLVGEAEFAEQVPALVTRATPDVVLLDVRLPDGSGLDVNRWLGAEHPTVRVVMLTMSEDLDGALGALRDGASGYLIKGAGPDRVEGAVRAGRGRRRRPRPIIGPSGGRTRRCPAVTVDAPVRSAHAARVRHFGTGGPRSRQHRDCPPSGAQPEDRAQPRVDHPRQDPRSRPAGSHRPRPPSWRGCLTQARICDRACGLGMAHAGGQGQIAITMKPSCRRFSHVHDCARLGFRACCAPRPWARSEWTERYGRRDCRVGRFEL